MGFTPKKTEKNMEKLMLSTSRPVYSKSGSFKCLSWVEYFVTFKDKGDTFVSGPLKVLKNPPWVPEYYAPYFPPCVLQKRLFQMPVMGRILRAAVPFQARKRLYYESFDFP
mgnify:CR=1 FL=1